MNLLIKICGVTSAKDAAMAAELGADAIGVNFWPGSKRYVDPADAPPILAAIPAGILHGRHRRSRRIASIISA